MEFDEIADELYGLAPGEFVAARGERVSAAKAAGDRALAVAVGKLARPTVAAWLVNLLVRAEPEQVGELLDLGVVLRDVQAAGSGDELRRLSVRRHVLMAALTRRAADLAVAAGQQVSDDAGRALAGTLEAALADPGAALAVRAGRLTRALSYAGLGPVEAVSTAPATSEQAGLSGRRRQDRGQPTAATPTPSPKTASDTRRETGRGPRVRPAAADQAHERKLRTARDELVEAEQTLSAARQLAADRESTVTEARHDLADARHHVDELTAQLERARHAADAAHAAAENAERELAEATTAAREADLRRSAALTALARLREPTTPRTG
ncbi:hypothetical protein [Pseudofrankia saprophytica]|nr:hypothetical protein [Pseudofrankia saprophytica]